MNFRHIICLTLLFCMFSVIPGYAYFQDTVNTDYQQAVDSLTALGILKGYDDGSFKPDGNITRAEFISAVIRFLGINDITNDTFTYYKDVGQNHWALTDINAATAMGLVSGYGGGTFNPDGNITVMEAVKIIVCALGYDYIAQTKGGYPAGYQSIAYEKGILKDVQIDHNSNATRGIIAKMLYNSLEVKLAEETSKGIQITDKTVLESKLGIQKKKGQITATKYGEITPVNKLEQDEIAIDSVIYKVTDPFIHELLGYTIDFYVKENDDDLVLVYYEVESDKNHPLLVWADKIERNNSQFSEKNFVYTDENEDIREEELSADYIIKNGERIPISSPDDLAPEIGNVLLIDSDDDGRYETVFVNDAENIVVQRTSPSTYDVYSKYSVVSVNLEKKSDREVLIIKDGKEIDFTGIKEWDVLTVYRSPSGKKTTVYVNDRKVSGSVDEVSKDNETGKLLINGVEYELSKSYTAALSDGAGNPPEPAVGMSGDFYFDMQGKIAAINKVTASAEKYALLVDAALSNSNFKLEFKILPEDGAMTIVEADEKLIINDGNEEKVYKYAEVIDKLRQTRVAEPGETTQDSVYQLIRFTKNAEGKIKKISVAKLPGADNQPLRDTNAFTRDYMSGTAVTNGVDIVNGAYKVPKTTAKIFVIPTDRSDDTKYKKEIAFIKATNYTMALYDMNEHNFVGAALVYQPRDEDYGTDLKYLPFFTADKVVKAVDEDDKQVFRVYGIYDKQAKYFDFETDPKIQQGDVFQVGLLDGKVAKRQQIYKAATDSYAKSTPWASGLGETGNATDQVYIAYLQVKDITNNTIVLTNGSKECLLNLPSSVRCTLYDRTNGKVKRSAVSEINIGDRVVVRTFELNAGDLVIVR